MNPRPFVMSSANVRDSASTWSSCLPCGNWRISSMSVAFHVARSMMTLPALTCAANGSARVSLFPDSGVDLTL